MGKKRTNIIDFKYQQVLEAKRRAKDRAAKTMRAIERDPTYVVIPPDIDPFAGNLEEEMAKVLFESELAQGEPLTDDDWLLITE